MQMLKQSLMIGTDSFWSPNEIGLYAMCGNVWEWTLMEDEKQTESYVIDGNFFEDSNHVE